MPVGLHARLCHTESRTEVQPKTNKQHYYINYITHRQSMMKAKYSVEMI